MRFKALSLSLSIAFVMQSCGILESLIYSNRTYIEDYREKMDLVERNFPEIYQLYREGEVVIDEVYTYERDGSEKVHIDYHYR